MRLPHPDSQAFTYAYDALSRLTGVYQGVGTGTPLDTFAYNADGLLASRTGSSGDSILNPHPAPVTDDVDRRGEVGFPLAGATASL